MDSAGPCKEPLSIFPVGSSSASMNVQDMQFEEKGATDQKFQTKREIPCYFPVYDSSQGTKTVSQTFTREAGQ